MKKYTVQRINELNECAKKEKNQRTRDRFKSLLLLSKGVKVKTICSVFNVHEDVLLYRWLPKWNSGDVKELTDKQRSGRPPLIKKDLRGALREYVLSQDRRIVCKELVDYVKKRWNIDCDDETLRKVLKNMKLSWQKPDKENHKADEKKREVFLKGASWCSV